MGIRDMLDNICAGTLSFIDDAVKGNLGPPSTKCSCGAMAWQKLYDKPNEALGFRDNVRWVCGECHTSYSG